jgi:hypothetical protein
VTRLVLGFVLGTAAAAVFHARERILPIIRFDRPRTPSVATAKKTTNEETMETADAPPADASEELERLTRAELYRRAQAAAIPGRAEMTKAELIAALRASAGEGPPAGTR